MQVHHHELVVSGVGRGAGGGIGEFLFRPTDSQLAPRGLLFRLHEGFQLIAAGEPVLFEAIVDVVHRQFAAGRVPTGDVIPEADAALLKRHERILES